MQTLPEFKSSNDAAHDFLQQAHVVMVSTLATQRRGRPAAAEPVASSTGVQIAKVTADEAGMRVDRFVEARFPGLAFSHIQRIIRKGELRVNGKRAQPKQRLEAGQAVRIPPLRLDQPRPSGRDAKVHDQTRYFLKSITLYEDADVFVLNKPMGLAVQGGSGTTRHLDGMLEALLGLRALAVHAQFALSGDALDVREGEPRKPRLDKAIDAHAGFVRRDFGDLYAGRGRHRFGDGWAAAPLCGERAHHDDMRLLKKIMGRIVGRFEFRQRSHGALPTCITSRIYFAPFAASPSIPAAF